MWCPFFLFWLRTWLCCWEFSLRLRLSQVGHLILETQECGSLCYRGKFEDFVLWIKNLRDSVLVDKNEQELCRKNSVQLQSVLELGSVSSLINFCVCGCECWFLHFCLCWFICEGDMPDYWVHNAYSDYSVKKYEGEESVVAFCPRSLDIHPCLDPYKWDRELSDLDTQAFWLQCLQFFWCLIIHLLLNTPSFICQNITYFFLR